MNLFVTEVISKKQLTSKLYELNIRLIEPKTISFKAGQCVGFHVGENEKKRLYSIASAPNQNTELSFVIDVSHMGPGSRFVLALSPGDQMTIEGPYGAFTVNDDTQDILLISTGAGVAPFKSIILDLIEKSYPREIILLFGVRSEEDKSYFDFFEELSHQNENFIFIPTLSQPQETWNGAKGRVTNFIDQNFEAYKNYRTFICGSPVMVKDVRALLMAKGKEARDIKLELFT